MTDETIPPLSDNPKERIGDVLVVLHDTTDQLIEFGYSRAEISIALV